MSDPNERWNTDDGPPPTDAEILAASRLADALDKGAPSGLYLDTEALVATALRVRAVERPTRPRRTRSPTAWRAKPPRRTTARGGREARASASPPPPCSPRRA